MKLSPVEYIDYFSRLTFDNGVNNVNKIKLPQIGERAIYSQDFPYTINLAEELLAKLAPLLKDGIITTLPFGKYACPIFAHRKPIGKL